MRVKKFIATPLSHLLVNPCTISVKKGYFIAADFLPVLLLVPAVQNCSNKLLQNKDNNIINTCTLLIINYLLCNIRNSLCLQCCLTG